MKGKGNTPDIFSVKVYFACKWKPFLQFLCTCDVKEIGKAGIMLEGTAIICGTSTQGFADSCPWLTAAAGKLPIIEQSALS